MKNQNSGTDVQRLIGEVAARHGVLLKPDDAAFALVTINQLVLEEVVATLLKRVEQTVAEFEATANRVQTQAISRTLGTADEVATTLRRELECDIAAAGLSARELVAEVNRAHTSSVARKWIVVGLVCAIGLLLCGAWIDRILR